MSMHLHRHRNQGGGRPTKKLLPCWSSSIINAKWTWFQWKVGGVQKFRTRFSAPQPSTPSYAYDLLELSLLFLQNNIIPSYSYCPILILLSLWYTCPNTIRSLVLRLPNLFSANKSWEGLSDKATKVLIILPITFLIIHFQHHNDIGK